MNGNMSNDFGRIMSGATISGVSENMKPNANIENGEYVRFPDGSVAKALGERHINGGIDVILPNMTQILSNTKDLKLNTKEVKKIQKKYGLKNISTNDKYSSVLTKYGKKIGYEKLLKEEEDLFNAVKRNSERALSEGSLRINNDYLAKKIFDIQKKKAPLSSLIEDMFNDLFVSQEKKKGVDIDSGVDVVGDLKAMGFENPSKEDIAMYKEYVNEMNNSNIEEPQQNSNMGNESSLAELQGIDSMGSDVDSLDETQVFALGGMFEDFKSLAKSNGYNLKDAYRILENEGIIPKYKDGATHNEQPSGTFKSNAKLYSKDAFLNFKNEYDNLRKYRYGQIDPMSERLKGLYSDAGISADGYDFSTLSGMDKAAGNYQRNIFDNNKAILTDYSSRMPPTNAGLKYLVTSGAISESELKANGISLNNPKGMILGKNKEDLTDVDIKKANDFILSKLSPEQKDAYLYKNFVDNKWDYRAPEIKTVQFDSQEDLDKTLNDSDGYVKLSDGTYKSDKTGLYVVPKVKDKEIPKVEPDTLGLADERKNTTKGEEPGETSNIDNEVRKRGNRYFQMPDQSFLPPLGLQPESLYLNRLGRLDPVAIGIEDTIRRNQEQNQFIGSQIQNLPTTVSAGVMANAIAQAQMSENQSIDNTHAINAANLSQAEQFNLRQADLESTGNNSARLDYERRALLGLSKTDHDLRNYYNAMRDVNINKFKEQQYMNTMANLFPKFTIDGSATGIEFSPTSNEYIDIFGNRLSDAYAKSSYNPSSTDDKTKKKKADSEEE